MTKITYIPGEIANAAIDEHGNRKPVTRTQHIFDDAKGKTQQQINANIDDALADRYTKAETYNKTQLNNMITTPNQQYVSVTATDQTTDVTDVLPDTGAANTIYRVGNWDGSQFDTTCYTEYAWDGTQYKQLDVKEYGLADEIEDEESGKLAKEGAVAKLIKAIDYGTYKFAFVDKDNNIICYLSNDEVFHYLTNIQCKSIDAENISGLLTVNSVNNDFYDFIILDKNDNIIIASSVYLGLIDKFGKIISSKTKENIENDVFERNKDKVDILFADSVYGSVTANYYSNRSSSDDGTKRLQLMVSTDTHTILKSFENAVDMSNKVASIDAIVHLGDFCNLLDPKHDNYDSNLNIMLSNRKPFFNAIGNHDVGTWSSYVMYCKDNNTVYDRYIKPSVDRGYLVEGEYQENTCYYFHDFTKEKVRLIVLYPYDDGSILDESVWKAITYDDTLNDIAIGNYNVGDKVNVPGWTSCSFEAKESVSIQATTSPLGKAWEIIDGQTVDYNLENNPRLKAVRYYTWYGQDQLDWFVNALKEAQENDYTVIVAQHYPSIYGGGTTPAHGTPLLDTRFNNPYRTTSIEFEARYKNEDKNIIAQILNCFINGGTINKTVYPYGEEDPQSRTSNNEGFGLDDASSIEPVELDYSFDGGGIALSISGHNHSDSVVQSNFDGEEKQLLHISFLAGTYIDAGRRDIVSSNLSDKNNDTMTGITVYSNKVHLTRIGNDTTIRVGEDGALIKKTNEVLTF